MKKTNKRKLKTVYSVLKCYFLISSGSLLSGIAISMFLSPAAITPGGISGIGIILNKLLGLPIGLFIILSNIPLFLIGTKTIGKEFLPKSLYGTFLLAIFTDLFVYIRPITVEPLLCAISGGVLLGLGMGIVFLVGATTGGTDILARLLNKRFPSIDISKFIFIIDIIIIISGGIVFNNYELSIYGAISLFVCTKLIDSVIQGMNSAKAVYIISKKHEEIADAVINDMDRGISGIKIIGMYEKKERFMLMCITKNHELPRLRKIVLSHDENAFIIFIGAHEVSGEGFKIYPIN